MPNFLRDCNTEVFEDRILGANVEVGTVAPAVVTTAGAATYLAENLLRGILVRDPNGAARSDVMPTAALMVAAFGAKYGSAKVGMVAYCLLVNSSDGAGTEIITVTAGVGATNGALPGAVTVAEDASRVLAIRLTVVAVGTEAYTFY